MIGSCGHCGHEADLQPIRGLRGDMEDVCCHCAADHRAYMRQRGFEPAASQRVPRTNTGLDPLESYYRNVILGVAIRQIARENDVHASTILRQIRRVEDQREDAVFDAACEKLSELGPEGVRELLGQELEKDET